MWGNKKADNKPEEYYTRGHTLYNQGRYEEALFAYEECLRCNPQGKHYHLALTGKLSSLQLAKRPEEALRFADVVYKEIDNTEVRAISLCTKAHILYFDLHRPEEARKQLYMALQKNPHYEIGLRLMAEVLISLQEYEEALRTTIDGLRYFPNSVLLYSHRGRALFFLKRYEEALAAFDTVARFEPEKAANHYNRGTALAMLKRYSLALAAHEQALRLDPANVTYQKQKESVLRLLNR